MSRPDRYIVTEIEGFSMDRGDGCYQRVPGLSVHVLDTAYCYRVVGSFRSEDRVPRFGAPIYGGGTRGPRALVGSSARGREGARRAGRELADRLNGGQVDGS